MLLISFKKKYYVINQFKKKTYIYIYIYIMLSTKYLNFKIL